MEPTQISLLLGLATLLPLASFFIILLAGPRLEKDHGAYVATAAIVGAGVLSFTSLAIWLTHHHPKAGESDDEPHAQVIQPHRAIPAGLALSTKNNSSANDTSPAGAATSIAGADEHDKKSNTEESHAEESHAEPAAGDTPEGHQGEDAGEHHYESPPYYTGQYYLLGKFGELKLEISYYIDSLTICMFCMVTLIASCIHIYAMGYMHDELHDVEDHEVTQSNGEHLKRPGRFYRFFQYMSLFCFSMLGLVLAGNIAMVFIFWELVGICSYFLIGFYVERQSASNAANKAFIVNRVGDFGMIIGLMALWSGLGTFAFGNAQDGHGNVVLNEQGEVVEPGMFELVKLVETDDHEYRVQPPAGMIQASLPEQTREEASRLYQGIAEINDPSERKHAEELVSEQLAAASTVWWKERGGRPGQWLLLIAGIGIFCGCVGKSAQFPLHVWLPDAMEGPTPVSALVHSATMVAAGVYLVGRFYPVFTPVVLLVIACVGCITLFMAATIAITATDIKRVLAYSTISQLGYMMLALGVGGWVAGLMHLITHAFFKSLLFMCSGSVIHAVHSNEMTEMGGLRKKMPITAYTMLVGCLAISGASLPFLVGFSGYYSKDAILEQAFSFMGRNSGLGTAFFVAAAGGAAITAFYMFRMWYMTFAGEPRNHHRYDHAHESPRVMTMPLVVLAVFATAVAWNSSDAMWGAVVIGLVAAGLFVWHFATTNEAFKKALRIGSGVLAGIALILALVAGIWGGQIDVSLADLLEQSRPHSVAVDTRGVLTKLVWPDEHASHVDAIKTPVTILATATALAGILLASFMYGLGYLNPGDVRRQFQPVYTFLINKWWFDELYDWVFIRPTLVFSRFVSAIDRTWIDGLIDSLARWTEWFARVWEKLADQTLVDGFVNLMASWTYTLGLSLRSIQTGKIRQYVMFIVIGAIMIFVLISMFWTPGFAG